MAIVGAVAIGATTAYSSNRQAAAAKDASRKQAEGVENARQDSLSAAERARAALSGQPQQPGQMSQPGVGGVGTAYFGQQQVQPYTSGPESQYLQGVQSGLQFTNQGYGQSIDTYSPLANLAQPYIDEQYNLLGMGGQDAYQQALGRVSDPLVAEQERALMRNSAQLGGVGGNELAALADMTRNRTEANIGQRLSQLSSASSPALTALQQIAAMQLNRGQDMSNIMRQSGSDLATMEAQRRQALANLELGQGSELAQLSQNLGNARSGYDVYRSQNAPWLAQGIQAGVGAYMGGGGGGLGGLFGGGGGGQPWSGTANQYNQYGGMA